LELYCYSLGVRVVCFNERDWAYKIAIGTQLFLCLRVISMTDQTYSEAYYKGRNCLCSSSLSQWLPLVGMFLTGKIPGIVCVLDWLNRATDIVWSIKSEITLDLRLPRSATRIRMS